MYLQLHISIVIILLNSTELLIPYVHDSSLFMIIVIASYDAEYLIIQESRMN